MIFAAAAGDVAAVAAVIALENSTRIANHLEVFRAVVPRAAAVVVA